MGDIDEVIMAKYSEKLKALKSSPINEIAKGNEFSDEYKNPELSEFIPDELEIIEHQIEKLKSKTWESAWHIGKRLIVIREKHLENTGYTSILEYAVNKFAFSDRTVKRFMFLAKNFDKGTALSLGSKLYLLTKLDEKQKQKYLDWIQENNATYREIQQKLLEDFPPAHRPKKEINLSQSKLTVDFRKMKTKIPKEVEEDFLRELKKLIQRFSK